MNKSSPASSPTSLEAKSVQPLNTATVLLAILLSALWGGNAVATSFAIDTMPPLAAAAVRFGLATVFMLFWCRVEKSRLGLRREQLIPAFVLGFLLFIQIATFNWGIWLSNSSHAVLLVNMAVFWVLIIEHYITLTHRLDGRKVLGVLIAASGTILILTTSGGLENANSEDQPTLRGDLVLILSAAILGVKIVYTRYAVLRIAPGTLMFWHDLIGGLLLLLSSLILEETIISNIDSAAIVALCYQGLVVGGFCFAAQAHLFRKHSASQIAIFAFAAPIFGIAVAQLMRDDPLSPWLIVATICVAAGIVLVNWTSKTESAEPLN